MRIKSVPVTINDVRGFTLVELVVVVGILIVLLTIASLSQDFVQKHRLTAASRELLGDLQKLRHDALTRSLAADSRGFGLRFASNTSYVIFEFNDADKDFVYDGIGEEASQDTRNLPSSITVTIGASGNPAGNTLIYDKRGMPRNTANWTLAANRTYVLRHPQVSQARCVSLTPAMIREGYWDGANCVSP